MVKINIYGCGISGLTIAHELIEKGFNERIAFRTRRIDLLSCLNKIV